MWEAEVEGNRTVNRYQSAYVSSAIGVIRTQDGDALVPSRSRGRKHILDFTQQTIGTPKTTPNCGGRLAWIPDPHPYSPSLL